MPEHKKLIEVALPLEAINKASAREKSIRHGHPSTLHLWWARRPLAAARAVIFAQMVDDPSGYVDQLKGDPKLLRRAEGILKSRHKLWAEATALQEKARAAGLSAPEPGPEPRLDDILAEEERQRLFRIIEELVQWENTTNETVLQKAREEIWQSWRRTCAENAGHPRAKELFDRHKLPAFHDPFAGGGALPLEAQRLGLEAYASDLNPVAVLINKAMIEIPPKFAGRPPVNPGGAKPGSAGISAGELKGKAAAKDDAPGWRSRGYLPHFDKPGLVQSITFRLHDSVPEKLVEQWKHELKMVEDLAGKDAGAPSEIELRKRIAKYEDAGHGECWLRDPRIASLVENALLHFDGERYRLIAWCIMPNHVHALIETWDRWPLAGVLHSWKSFTASEANKILARSGTFWFREYHDRFVRDENHFAKAVEYIEQNPVKAGLVKEAKDWKFSSAGKKDINSPAGMLALPGLWRGAQGLAEDVRYYGKWMRDEAEKRIGHLYPKVKVVREKDGTFRHATAEEWEDETKLPAGSRRSQLTVIAWLWARTVKSPNPAFRDVDVPLASTFLLSTKPGKEAWVSLGAPASSRPERGYEFTVRCRKDPRLLSEEEAQEEEAARMAAVPGTKLGRGANFRCVMSGTPIAGDYIKAEGKAGRMGARLMAIVAEGDRGRVYLPPTPEHEAAAKMAKPEWKPDVEFFQQALGFRVGNYGMTKWSDLFSERQTNALTTFADVAREARDRVQCDAMTNGFANDGASFDAGGCGAAAYADAAAVCLAFALDKSAVYWNSLCPWLNQPKNEIVGNSFSRQTVQMVWDYAEANPFCDSGGNISKQLDYIGKYLDDQHAVVAGHVLQADAAVQSVSTGRVVSTDPPYYDNIGYADLSDFFYVWLRRALRPMFPQLFATLAVPKAEELVATPHRHGGTEKAEAFFLGGMTKAMHRLAELAHSTFPITIYYAFKQAEGEEESGTSSTGWETFLDAVIRAGFATTGTWPMRTERPGRMRDFDSNALASSIVLVCRPRAADAPTATRREFVAALQRELPEALRRMQAGNIAPVDLAQAAIGPGMAVFTRYARVLDAQGNALSVREALALINETLDTALAEQEGDFDADSRWALAWFEQHGFAEGEYGVAETLSKAKNTSVKGLEEAGILVSSRGKVRLLRPEELPADWDPATDTRLTHWETVHHLIRVLSTGGESGAAELVAKLGSKAEVARELAYRLYTLCERKKRATEALAYNGLVQSWPELARLASEQKPAAVPVQADLELK